MQFRKEGQSTCFGYPVNQKSEFAGGYDERFFIISAVIAGIFLIDILYNDIITKFFPLMNALTFYEKLGWMHK